MDKLLQMTKQNLDKAVQANKHYASNKNIGSAVVLATHIMEVKKNVEDILQELISSGVDINRIEANMK